MPSRKAFELCRSNGGRNTGEILSAGVQIPSQRTWIVPVVAGALSFIAGLTILFIVWASSDGIGQATWAKVIWPIVSFPLFTLISKDFATLYFWEVAVTNNLLWAGAVASLMWAQAVGKTRMPKAKSVLLAVSVAIISTGLVIIGVGAFFLKRLDDHAFGDPGVFYAAVRHYASVTSAGVPVCLAGCIALAILLDYKQGFRAGVTSIFIAFAVAIFGLFLFPIHFPSGNVYFSLLGVTFGASFVFVSVAAIRYFSNRIRFTHGKHLRSETFPE